jgi:WD40 repeat protein
MVILLFVCATPARVRSIGQSLPIRPITIRNIAFNSNGTIFAVPNFVSAGSVAFFWVNVHGAIAPVPTRLSEKNFVRSSGLFFLRKKNENDPEMAFANLPELLTGYSVNFSSSGDTMAIAGGDKVVIYAGKNEKWEIINTLTVGTSVTRAVFSPDGQRLAVLSEGKLFLFSTSPRFALVSTVVPENESKFSDVTFSHDNSKCALFEFRATLMDYGSRIRIFDCNNNDFDRNLPYFPLRPSTEPGKYLPLVSYGPADSLLAVTLPATFSGKIYLIKSNDGAVYKEYKGYCHAFSPDGTLFVAQSAVFSTKNWSEIGKIPRSTLTCAFSPTERAIVTVTQDAINRFRIEE